MNLMKQILFNTEMVREIQNNRKSVTRRVMKGVPETAHMFLGINQETQKAEFLCGEIRNGICADFGVEIALPYKVGDILYVRETWKQAVWEPACGEGHLSERLKQYGYSVYSSDLVYRGYGTGEFDF